jgi:phosphatidylinositol alpha-mannosyltransferase
MKVTLVCPYAWDRYGGVQSHVRALADSLRTRSHDVHVLAPRASRAGSAPESSDGALLVGRSLPVPANGSVAPLAFGPGAGAATRRALRELRPDVIHLHEPLIPSVSLLALLNAAAPTVGTFHAAAPRSLGYGVSRALLDRAVRRLTRRTAVSEAARELVSSYFPGDYAITPNGVDVARFDGAIPRRHGPGRTVVFHGRIEPRKGLDLLIEATAALDDPGVTLVVSGSGPEVLPAKALAKRLRVTTRWLGRVSDEDLPGLYAGADVFCAPGIGGESFGIVLLEAMAAGAPVVCSGLPAFRSVAGDAARFFRPGDARDLARVLRETLADDALRSDLGSASRAVARRFDWAHLAGRVEEIYEDAASRPREYGRPPGRPRRRTGRRRGAARRLRS